MKKLIFPLISSLFAFNVSASNGVGDIRLAFPGVAFQYIFNIIKTLILTDSSRIILAHVFLFIIISKVLITAMKNTRFDEHAASIANSFAGFMIISIFFKARNYLDRFSWYVIVLGIIVSVFMLFKKIFGRFFHRNYNNYRTKQNTIRQDDRRGHEESQNVNDEANLVRHEENLNEDEQDFLKALDSKDAEEQLKLLRQLMSGGH